MDNLKEQLLKEIRCFVKNALITNELFKKQFNIVGPPFKFVRRSSKHNGIIPMKGILYNNGSEINYKFHGNGCEFIFPENRIIDINYQLPDWKYDGRISFYRIRQFVKSNISEFEDKDLLEKYLCELEEDGVITPIPPPSDFKERMAAYEEKSIEELEENGFFEAYKRPKHKAYYLSK